MRLIPGKAEPSEEGEIWKRWRIEASSLLPQTVGILRLNLNLPIPLVGFFTILPSVVQ